MAEKHLEPTQAKSKLNDVREGMEVHDSREQKIGTVKEVYFGASSGETDEHGVGAATAPDPSQRDNSLIDDIARGIFGADEVPEEMRQRLINEGFVRIDPAGLFKGERYALPDQIASIHDNHIHLTVAENMLLKR